MSASLWLTLGLLGIGGGFFLWFERAKHYDAKVVAVIATIAALAGAFRIPFAFLPNVQPTTFLVMTAGFIFGPGSGFMMGAIATLVSNTFLGHGPWTPWQMLAWGLAGFYGGILGLKRNSMPKVAWTVHLFLWGFLFDYIMNIWHYVYFVYPHTLRSFIAVYASSFLFDISHAIGNGVFAWIFGEELMTIFGRFKNKLVVMDASFERMNEYEKVE